MSSEAIPSQTDNRQTDLHPADQLRNTVLNEMLEMYSHAKHGFADHFHIPSKGQEDELSLHRTKQVRRLNNVSLESLVWRGRCRISGQECVCFRINVTPAVGGDNTNFVSEFVIHALKMYNDVVVTSDHEGMYLIW